MVIYMQQPVPVLSNLHLLIGTSEKKSKQKKKLMQPVLSRKMNEIKKKLVQGA
jgi:hypothetical protein